MLTFNLLLQTAGLALSDVRLMRHATHQPGGTTPYVLWRDRRDLFEAWQRTQSKGNAAKVAAPFWASFVGVPDGRTLFAGLYRAAPLGTLTLDRTHAELSWAHKPGIDDDYDVQLDDRLRPYIGLLYVAWGDGTRSWVQRADRQDKPITELTASFAEPPFPGFDKLVMPLSDVDSMPPTWAAILSETRGVYVLSCPRTKEQYVGIAHGVEGFLGRWRQYAATGHGGNVALRSREPADYQVAILQSVGSAATVSELEALEAVWKRKLQSREMGLNRN